MRAGINMWAGGCSRSSGAQASIDNLPSTAPVQHQKYVEVHAKLFLSVLAALVCRIAGWNGYAWKLLNVPCTQQANTMQTMLTWCLYCCLVVLYCQISSVEEADKKMGELAEAGKIDPAFLQITAKAYGAARDTNMTLDEAKWVAYRLYVRARDHFDRQQPREKRILEYLVVLRDPAERSRQLDAALTPGPTRYTDSHDYLWSTPARLYAVLDGTLKAFDAMQAAAKANMNSSDQDTTPRKVRAMRELREEIRRKYL